MTIKEQILGTIKLDGHTASHAMAEHIYVQIREMESQGLSRDDARAALKDLYDDRRLQGDAIQRDAFAEVLDALEADDADSRRAKSSLPCQRVLDCIDDRSRYSVAWVTPQCERNLSVST